MDKLRNSLYDEFKPQIKILEEVDLDAGFFDNSTLPLVATKKVTQMRIPPLTMPDNQPEIMPLDGIETPVAAIDLPPAGPLVKPLPDVGDVVYIMKNPLMPWVKAKVRISGV